MARKSKPYKAKSLSGAQAYVRMLIKQRREMTKLLDEFARQRMMLAKMAADGPAFYSLHEAMEAKALRDKLLINSGINIDGSPIGKQDFSLVSAK